MYDLQSQPNVQQRNSNQTQRQANNQQQLPWALKPTRALDPLPFLRSFNALSNRRRH